jgi:hypothetical protein
MPCECEVTQCHLKFLFYQNCEQEVVLPGGKVANLLTDFVAIDMLKPKAEKQAIICTSCKAQEEAIARCQDCPNFLCSNCYTAHQFMRCFEDHRVGKLLYYSLPLFVCCWILCLAEFNSCPWLVNLVKFDCHVKYKIDTHKH